MSRRVTKDLPINSAIPELLDGTDSNPLDEYELQVETLSGDLVVIDDEEGLKQLRIDLTEEIVRLAKVVVIAKIREEIAEITHEELPDWRALEVWTDYAIDSGAGRFEAQFQAVLLRCWLLQREMKSTELRNFWKTFLRERVSWQELEGEIQSLEGALRASAERQS